MIIPLSWNKALILNEVFGFNYESELLYSINSLIDTYILQVLEVKVKRRTGKDNFVSCMRKSLQEHYGDKSVGIGGSFIIQEGKAKLHIMVSNMFLPLLITLISLIGLHLISYTVHSNFRPIGLDDSFSFAYPSLCYFFSNFWMLFSLQ